MTIITDKQIFDYIDCPAKYDLKYIKRMPVTEEVTMYTALKEIESYFYSNLLNNNVCSMDELKKRWDIVCKKYPMVINDKKCLEGINYVYNFAKWNSENKTHLVDFNSDYEMNINGITIQGTIGAVAITKDKKCELIVNRFSKNQTQQSDIDKSLKITMDCYAFKKLTGHEINIVRVINMKDRRELYTYRTNTDFNRLVSTLNNVCNAISMKIVYPRENIFCGSCPYENMCKYWC